MKVFGIKLEYYVWIYFSSCNKNNSLFNQSKKRNLNKTDSEKKRKMSEVLDTSLLQYLIMKGELMLIKNMK